jgi:hypothetical protein
VRTEVGMGSRDARRLFTLQGFQTAQTAPPAVGPKTIGAAGVRLLRQRESRISSGN